MTIARDILDSIQMASSAVRANLLRTSLTMLGIIIGIVTVTLMGSFLIGINDMFHSTVSFMGTDVYYVAKFDWAGKHDWMLMRNRPDVTIADADQLRRRMTTAKAIAVSTQQWGIKVKYKNKSIESATAVGVDEPYQTTSSLKLDQGRFLSTAELSTARPVCIIGAEMRDKLFGVDQNAVGEIIRVGGYPLEVVGVAKRVGGMFGVFTVDNQSIMPLRTFFNAFGDPHRDVTVSVKAMSPVTRLDTRDELEFQMRQIRGLKPGKDNNFGINSQDEFNKQIAGITLSLDVVGFLITGLSLLVGGIGIMNIMFVTVKERTREIGIRKAMGARRRSILVQFLSEASMISFGAGLIAIAIAYGLTLLISQRLSPTSAIKVDFPVSVALMGITVSIAVGLISGLLPALRASRLNPVDALRYE